MGHRQGGSDSHEEVTIAIASKKELTARDNCNDPAESSHQDLTAPP